jgi:hypothetical protein
MKTSGNTGPPVFGKEQHTSDKNKKASERQIGLNFETNSPRIKYRHLLSPGGPSRPFSAGTPGGRPGRQAAA